MDHGASEIAGSSGTASSAARPPGIGLGGGGIELARLPVLVAPRPPGIGLGGGGLELARLYVDCILTLTVWAEAAFAATA